MAPFGKGNNVRSELSGMWFGDGHACIFHHADRLSALRRYTKTPRQRPRSGERGHGQLNNSVAMVNQTVNLFTIQGAKGPPARTQRLACGLVREKGRAPWAPRNPNRTRNVISAG